MNDDKEDALYLKYQQNLRELDERQESYKRKRLSLEQDKEECRQGCIDDRARITELIETWGNSADSNEISGILEESITAEKLELEKREQELDEELALIRRDQAQCDEEYQKKRYELSEEEGVWQEESYTQV